MMKRTDDSTLWAKAWMDTPFTAKGSGPQLREGVCVKSKERDAFGKWPKFFGKVCMFDTEKDVAVVRSTMEENEEHRFAVWTGAVSDCLKMWDID